MERAADDSDGMIERATRYKKTCLYFSDRHYKAAATAFRRHQMLGIPAVTMGAIVTTSIFATLNTSPSIGWKICAGAISLVGASLSAVQTFLKFSDSASKHKTAAAGYRALARKVDIFLLNYKASRSDDPQTFRTALRQLEKIAESLSELGGQAPHVTRTTQNDESELELSERIP